MSPDGILPEIVERPDHPWFVGVQFHPELKSRPFEPHPLFTAFIRAAIRAVAPGVADSHVARQAPGEDLIEARLQSRISSHERCASRHVGNLTVGNDRPLT